MRKYIIEYLEMIEYEKNYSKNTIIAYKENLLEFLNFIESNMIKKCTYDDIRKYMKELYDKKYTNSSICRQISCLRGFFKYLYNNNYIDDNPMLLISNPKMEKRLPKFLYYEDLEKILSTPDEKNYLELRNLLIIELLYSTGVRVDELVNIKLSDIDFDARKIKILGKGNKERYVFFGTRCLDLINKYLSISRKILDVNNSEFLLLSKTGKKINSREVRNIINQEVEVSGLKIKISPHTFRHTYATHMLNEGADLRVVQELLGHENLSTTTIYTHLTNEKLRSEYLKAHPRAHKEEK